MLDTLLQSSKKSEVRPVMFLKLEKSKVSDLEYEVTARDCTEEGGLYKSEAGTERPFLQFRLTYGNCGPTWAGLQYKGPLQLKPGEIVSTPNMWEPIGSRSSLDEWKTWLTGQREQVRLVDDWD